MSKGPNKAPGRKGEGWFGQNVGVMNIGLAQGAKLPAGAVNGAMARPLQIALEP